MTLPDEMIASHRKSIPNTVKLSVEEVIIRSTTISNPNTPPDHDDNSNIEFPIDIPVAKVRLEPRLKRSSRLSQSLQRHLTSCIKWADVALLRSEIDKELESGLKIDDEYFRSEQRQRQQDEFRALLDAIKTE